MTTLVLKLAGPLQSWGDTSRFNLRHTREEPTKSGVLGLLAAAHGRRRTDPIEDLLGLRFGVRTDQRGTVLRDFQTEIDWRTGKSKPLTHRYYLADAIFLAAVEGDESLVSALYEALLHPTFPLYLGRRSCPPSDRVLVGLRDLPFDDVLRTEPWIASERFRRPQPAEGVRLPIARDSLPGEVPHDSVHDIPLSFDVRHRDYGWREIVRELSKPVVNEIGRPLAHDPFALIEEQ